MTYWYRFEMTRETNTASNLDRLGKPTIRLHLRKLKVLRETPKGVQLIGGRHGRENPRLVLHASKKKFAHPDRKGAWESFHAKRIAEIGVYKQRISDIYEALDLVNRFEEGPDW